MNDEEVLFPYSSIEINESMKAEKRDYRLEKAYELCVNELGLQQKKRDQTIAFYVAIISFVIPALINLKQSTTVKGAGFMALYVLGIMLTQVVVRYRVYKEVYWITCRVITQLYQFNPEAISKEIVQHLFFKNVHKNKTSVLVFRDEEQKRISRFKTYRKNLNSSETILYHILVLMSSMVLWIGVYMLIDSELWGLITASILAVANMAVGSAQYYKHLTRLYRVVIDKQKASFDHIFSKAWFLHFY